MTVISYEPLNKLGFVSSNTYYLITLCLRKGDVSNKVTQSYWDGTGAWNRRIRERTVS